MAEVPGSPSAEAVPQWKRDLLERRRASARSISASSGGLGVVSLGLTCPGVVAAVRHPGPGPAGPSASDFHPPARSGRSGPESPAEPPQPQPDRDRAAAAAAAAESVPVGFGGGNMRLVEQLQLQRDDITFNGQDDLKQRFVNMGEEKMLLPLSGPRALGRVPRAAKQYLAKVANNKGDAPAEDECNSDSSEELQYGPGIVKKLKSKYLSMTLRESGSRPSLSSMRRATSLENLLDEETTIIKPNDTKPAHFVKRVSGNNTKKVVTHQSRSAEPTQRDMKRARSMETLLRYDPKLHMSHSNSGLNVHLEDVEKDENDSGVGDNRERNYVQNRKSVEDEKEDPILLRKKLAITVEETELPPPDLVKQTLKIFESSGSPGSASPPVPQARSSVNKSNNFKTNNAKPVPKVKNSVSKKPQVSPKPVFSPEKLRSVKVASPKKSVENSEKVPISDSVSASLPCRNADTSPVPVSPVSPLSSPVTPPTSAVSPIQVRSSTKRSPPSPRKTMGLPVLSPTEDKPPPIPRRDKSPSSSAPVTPGTPVTPLTPVAPSTPMNGNSNGRPESLDIRPIYSASDSDGEIDDVDAVTSKSVSSSALENIRKDGTSMQFSFGSNKSPSNDAAKSYLPRVKPTPPKDLPIPPKSTPTNCVRSMSPFESHNQDHSTRPGSVINVASLPHGAVLKSPESPVQHAKQVGVIRPLVSTKHHSPHNSSPSPATPTLTNREIEKNLINRAKSIEQPVTKVVVSLKKLPDDVVVGSVSHSALAFAVNGDQAGSTPAPVATKRGQAPGLWDKKPWHHQDNTMVFNFSNRKEVPDYIENDGLILRGDKRQKQRDGGSAGGVLLLGASAGDESSTDGDMGDVDDWGLVSCDPPSPCTVVFEGSNVIINGRSNLRKQSPRQPRKLRIQFNDEATTMFEYPSEASLLEDGAGVHGAPHPPPPSAPAPAPPSPAPGLPVPLGSGSLASYTPSKLQMGVNETFQLGVTRAPSSSPSSSPDDAASGASTASSVETIEADNSDLGDSDHLKPAREGESVTWSEESGTDLLF